MSRSTTRASRRQAGFSGTGSYGGDTEPFEVAGTTYTPGLVPRERAPNTEKAMFFEKWVQHVDAKGGKPRDKVNALTHPFGDMGANVLSEVTTAFRPLYDPQQTSNPDLGNAEAGNHQVFAYSNIQYRNRTNGASITRNVATFTTRAGYISFMLEVRPGNLLANYPGHAETLDTNMTIPFTGNNHAAWIDPLQHYDHPDQLFAAARNNDSNCVLGDLSSHNRFDSASWNAKYREIYHKILYASVRSTLRARYAGDAVDVASSFLTKLTSVKQLVTDPRVNRQYLTSVQNYSDRVMQVINAFPPDTIVPTDVCNVILSNLETSFRESVEHNPAIVRPAYVANETGRDATLRGRTYLAMLTRADDQIRLQRKTLLRHDNTRESATVTVQTFFAAYHPNLPAPAALGDALVLPEGSTAENAGSVTEFLSEADRRPSMPTAPYSLVAAPNQLPQFQPAKFGIGYATGAAGNVFMTNLLDRDHDRDPDAYATQRLVNVDGSAGYTHQPFSPLVGTAQAFGTTVAQLIDQEPSTAPSPTTVPFQTQEEIVAYVAASYAESALCNAKGIPVREIGQYRCFGCGDTNHRWLECPKRMDPAVQAQARTNRNEWWNKVRGSTGPAASSNPYAPPPRVDTTIPTAAQVDKVLSGMAKDPASHGFTSEEQASLIMSIASPVTRPQDRGALLNELRRRMLRDKVGATVQFSIAGSREGGSGDDDRKLPPPPISLVTIPLMSAAMFSALSQKLSEVDIRLKISQQLPMIDFPIGPEENKTTLSMLLDTGAGSSIGNLDYHAKVAEKYPNVFAVQPIALSELSGSEDSFTIGGVGKAADETQSNACIVTHLCAYVTPYVIEGRQVRLVFALSPQCSINTIAGFPLLYGCGMSILLDSMVVVSNKLGVTMPVQLRRPGVSSTVPDMPEDIPAALPTIPQAYNPAKSPNVCQHLQAVNDLNHRRESFRLFRSPYAIA